MVTVDSYILHPVTYSVVNIIMHWPSEVADCDKSQTHVKSCIKSCGYHGYFHAHAQDIPTHAMFFVWDRVSLFFPYDTEEFNRSKSIVCVTWDGCGPGGTLYFKWWGWLNVGKNQNPKKSNQWNPKNPWTKNQLIFPCWILLKWYTGIFKYKTVAKQVWLYKYFYIHWTTQALLSLGLYQTVLHKNQRFSSNKMLIQLIREIQTVVIL